MRYKDIKLQEIANLAGVSLTTVSRAYNHRDQVKAETLKKIEQAMDELGYSLPQQSSKSSDLIIVEIPSYSNPFYSEVVSGMLASAGNRGYVLLSTQEEISNDNVERILETIKSVSAKGLIAMNQMETEAAKRISEVVQIVQCCELNSELGLPFVTIDDYSAAITATNYLLSVAKEKKIALLNGPLSYKYAVERERGFRDALASAGLEPREDWVISLPEISFSIAYTVMLQLLKNADRPSAVFAVSDTLAAAVLRAAKECGIRVPEDLVVLGFDNLDIAKMTTPSLSSIRQPRFQLGYAAMELCIKKIRNPSISPQNVVLNTELIVRESTSY